MHYIDIGSWLLLIHWIYVNCIAITFYHRGRTLFFIDFFFYFCKILLDDANIAMERVFGYLTWKQPYLPCQCEKAISCKLIAFRKHANEPKTTNYWHIYRIFKWIVIFISMPNGQRRQRQKGNDKKAKTKRQRQKDKEVLLRNEFWLKILPRSLTMGE